MEKEREISFKIIGEALNIHQFIIWEFVRRYGYDKGITKDRKGRGVVQWHKANLWIDKLAKYLKFQEYSYKQEINKGQYTYISRERFQREKESEQDVEREYGVNDKAQVIRTTKFANGGVQVWVWNWLTYTWQLTK